MSKGDNVQKVYRDILNTYISVAKGQRNILRTQQKPKPHEVF